MRKAVLIFLLFLIASPGAAETGRVTRVIDGDTLKVQIAEREETVRLIGVDTPETGHRNQQVERFSTEATDFVRRLAHGKTVTLRADPQAHSRDKHGRALRYVILPDGKNLSAEIIAGGYGHVLTGFPFSKLEAFRKLERQARSAERGLWQPEGVPTLDAADSGRHIGREARVCGIVASARFAEGVRGQPTFLNLGQAYPKQLFTVLIWGSDRAAFREPETRLRGEQICVTGTIRSRRGKPQIVARDPSQITPPS